MDKIIIHGLEFFGYHGVNEDEKLKGQRFILDLDVVIETFNNAAAFDKLEFTVDYCRLLEKIRTVMEDERHELLETLGVRIANLLLEESLVTEIKLKIKKPDAPAVGVFEYVGVEIIRRRYDEA